MPMRQQRARTLPQALRDGRLDRRHVERSADRLLATQIRYAARARPAPPAEVVASPEHRELARETARRGAVLLRNEPVGAEPALPLAAGRLRRVAVAGRLADQPNLGDVGSSQVCPPDVVTILDGLRERLGERVVVPAAAGAGAARAAARDADAAVVVVGLTAQDEGEALVALDADAMRVLGGLTRWKPAAAALSRIVQRAARRTGGVVGGDRRDLRLHAEDVELISAVAAVNARTVVVVIGGGTVVVDPWDREVAAVLLAWYPGMAGGSAIADVLLGDAEPGGRLPITIPRRQADLPTVDWSAHTVTYGRWWGQRALDRAGVAAAYPFGFGLSYTTFSLGRFTAGPATAERFPATVDVTNTGTRPGRHVVQIYARMPPVRPLLGFASVELEPGQTRTVTIDCTTRPLQHWTGAGFTLDAGRIVLEAASHSRDPSALTADLKPA
jgi:beta-glucosidase